MGKTSPEPPPAATIRSRSIRPIPLPPRKTLARSRRSRRLLLLAASPPPSPAARHGRSPPSPAHLRTLPPLQPPERFCPVVGDLCLLRLKSTSTARCFFYPQDPEGKKMEGAEEKKTEGAEEKKTEDPVEKKIEDLKAKKVRLIPQLVHSMSTYCWMLAGLGSFYFFVFTVTNFAPLAAQFMSPPPASPSSKLLVPAPRTTLPPVGCTPMLAQYIAMYAPSQVCALLSTTATDCTPMLAQYIATYVPGQVCAMLSTTTTDRPASCASPPSLASHSSQSDKLKSDISGWNRLTVAFLLGAVFLIATVKPRVDAAAKAEDRAATKEDKAYEAALDELSKAHKDAARALEDVHGVTGCIFPAPRALDPHVTHLMNTRDDAVNVTRKADKKVEDLRALVGVARMGKVERLMVCSAAAFFRSAELEQGDSMSLGAVIGTIAVPGVPMVLAHVHFFYVALREN